VAHSISGYGAIAANVEGEPLCTAVRDFAAYKVTQAAIMLGGWSETNKGTALVSIDTGYGIGIHGGGCGNVVLEDSVMYGENADNQDCHPDEQFPDTGGVCDYCVHRYGLTLASMYHKEHRDREIEHWYWMPLFNYSDCFIGTVEYNDLRFKNFETKETTCGSRQRAIYSYELQPNYVPFIKMDTIVMDNVHQDAVAWLSAPPDYNPLTGYQKVWSIPD
jgi:hypothetical protein